VQFRRIHGFSRRIQQWFALLALLLLSSASYGQTCALCYTQAASAGDRIIQGLRSGILVLVIPPMFMSVGITVLAYRKRNRCGGPTSSERARNDW
jgi:hypothetical protein